MFLIHQAIANDLSLMNPQAQGDTLDSSGVFLPVDLLTETPSNQFATPTWSSEKISNSEPGLGPILSPFAALASGCNNRIGNSQEQTFTPSRFRRSLAGINKRRIPDFCNFQPTDRPVVAPQKLEEGTSDPSTPSPETPHPGVPGKSNSAPSVGPSKGPASNEEIRALIYSLPGINGEPNPAACDILLKPLHKVPICVPPHPARDSVAEILSPARLCEFLFPKYSSTPLRHTSHTEETDTSLTQQLQISISNISEIRRL